MTVPLDCRAYASATRLTDGVCAYAAIVVIPSGRRVVQHAYRRSSRDRVAIIAATHALRLCPTGSSVRLYVDRRRVYDVIADGKLEQWRFDGWKARVGGKPIQDADLWRDLDEAVTDRDVTVVLADRDNEQFAECDLLARRATQSPIKLTDAGYQPLTNRSRPRRSKTKRSFPPKQEGDPCSRCQTPVTRRPVTGQRPKAGQRYRWAWILRCDSCGARYQTKEGRRVIDTGNALSAIA